MVKPIAIFIAVSILLILTFYTPSIDKSISLLAYDEYTHKFYGEIHTWCSIVYHAIPFITALCIVIPILILIFSKVIFSPPKVYPTRKACIIILLSLALGPGIIVNSILKDNWGRARPYQVLRDHEKFSPVWQAHITLTEDNKDNSFPSGHASIGFFLGVPFLAYKKRYLGIIVSLCFGSIVGLVRILQGGHYFSDVLFCALFVWLSAELVNSLVNRIMKD